MTTLAGRNSTSALSLQPTEEDETLTTEQWFATVRDEARVLHEDSAGLHDRVADHHHDVLRDGHGRSASKLQQHDPVDLLERLNEAGYAWRDVAELVGVSVPALRKWRKRMSAPSPEHRRAIADLVALHDRLLAIPITDPAGWLHVRLDPAAPITGMDLAVVRRWDLLLAIANGHLNEHDALDQHQPGWRAAYESDWESFSAADGHPAIRRRSR